MSVGWWAPTRSRRTGARATGDLDVRVRADAANARRVIAVLQGFGAPIGDLTEADLTRPGTVFQIGVALLRIDVLTAMDGVEFEEAWCGRIKAHFADQDVAVLSGEHLIRKKRAAGRAQDLADLEWLEKEAKR